ncbi:glycosyltransferase [Propionibacteriaceae bacterium G1746]|uniref:glycosyltransferase n=1 Tax=Aestuariimicrobium sp. G57 TaxID=3418485 RepID=UPI003C2226E5
MVIFMPGLASGGGAERYAVGLAAALRALGHPRVVIASDGATRDEIARQFGIDMTGIEVADVPTPPGWLRRAPQSVFDLVELLGWRHAVAHLNPSVMVNCLYRAELPGLGSRQNVYVCHFPHPLRIRYTPAARGLFMSVMGWLQRVLVTRAPSFLDTYDQVVANSEFTADHVRKRWGVEPVIVPPPCASMLVPGVPKQRRIVTVGRFEPPVPGVPNKRLDVLVDTFAAMTDLHAEGWELHVAGACPDASQAYLDDLRRAAGKAPVTFHPNLPFDNLQQLYSSGQIYWHAQGYGESLEDRPETQEHFGITTVEAMSAGAIPVVIDTAGPWEVVLPVDGAGRWTTTMQLEGETRRIISMPADQRDALAARCQRRAEEFSPEAFGNRIAVILGRKGQYGNAS